MESMKVMIEKIKEENGICLIVTGGKFVDVDADALGADYIIACDRGLDNADKYGLIPDLAVGDFDSVSKDNLIKMEESGLKNMRYPKEKDDTDTMIAIKQALDMGFFNIKILCAFGGRTDHTFANIQAARYAAERGAVVELIDEGSKTTVFANVKIEFERQKECFFSVFSLSDKSEGVSIKGTKYELEEYELTGDFPLGVSNEFVQEKAAVSVRKGCLMVVIADVLSVV